MNGTCHIHVTQASAVVRSVSCSKDWSLVKKNQIKTWATTRSDKRCVSIGDGVK